jgi:hypothetical protein
MMLMLRDGQTAIICVLFHRQPQTLFLLYFLLHEQRSAVQVYLLLFDIQHMCNLEAPESTKQYNMADKNKVCYINELKMASVSGSFGCSFLCSN